MVVNPDYNESRWVTYKAHCGPMRKVVDDFKATNPLPPSPYNVAINSFCRTISRGYIMGIAAGRETTSRTQQNRKLPWGSERRQQYPFQWIPLPRKHAGEQSDRSLCRQSSLCQRPHFYLHQGTQFFIAQHYGTLQISLCMSPSTAARDLPPSRPVPVDLQSSRSHAHVRQS